jgi:hypothetical protein
VRFNPKRNTWCINVNNNRVAIHQLRRVGVVVSPTPGTAAVAEIAFGVCRLRWLPQG